MPSLPLKVQIGIRDEWTNADSPVQESLSALSELLGHSVVIEPEWQLLLAELGDLYADKGNFVAVVAGCIRVWIASLSELLGDSAHEDWTDTLLERTAAAGSHLRVFVEVSSNDKASTSWSDRRGAFVVQLPKAQVYQPAELFPVFRGGLLAGFQPEEKRGIPDRTTADDWADVEVDGATGQAEVVGRHQPAAAASTDLPAARVAFLPSAASLPRPDELLLRPPYHLVVHAGQKDVEIHGSHSPSLKLLADYLRRWCRVNHHDSRAPPGVDVKLHQSAFGLGEMFDRLVLSTRDTRYTDEFGVTAPMVVSLIEGVLGYDCVSARPNTWSFRRDAAFKSL